MLYINILVLCANSYVEETSRNLRLRVAEHKVVSARTGYQITNSSFSSIRPHYIDLQHELNEDNLKVLIKANYPSDTKILKALIIHKLKPELNNQTTSHSSTTL